MTDLNAGIPKRGDKARQRRLECTITGLGHNHHEVGIRGGVEFATAIATHRHQAGLLAVAAHKVLPKAPDNGVHHLRAQGDEFARWRALEKARSKRVVGIGEGLL